MPERLASLDRGLRDIVAALPTLRDDLRRVRDTVEPQQQRVAVIESAVSRMEVELHGLSGALTELKADAQDVTEHLPDPDETGPLTRARELLTGDS